MTEINDYLEELQKNIVISVDDNKIYYFKSVIDELYDIAEKNNNYSSMNKQVTGFIADARYASGCKAIHRGFYCPSPIIDLVVGGCKRGRLVNKPTKASQEYYQYCFDNTQQLICIHQFLKPSNSSPYSTEFIIRQEDLEYGITYHNDHKDICYLAKCEYENNKIKSYASLCYFDGIPKDMMSLQFEEYEYTTDTLSKAVMYPGIVPKYNLYNSTEYEFLHDSNGKIVEYIAKTDYQGHQVENRYKV